MLKLDFGTKIDSKIWLFLIILFFGSPSASGQQRPFDIPLNSNKKISGVYEIKSKSNSTVILLIEGNNDKALANQVNNHLVNLGVNACLIQVDPIVSRKKSEVESERYEFGQQWKKVRAVVAFLESKGVDGSRIGICGIGRSAKVAMESAIRLKGSIRCLSLISPSIGIGKERSLQLVKNWRGQPIFASNFLEWQDGSGDSLDYLKKMGCLRTGETKGKKNSTNGQVIAVSEFLKNELDNPVLVVPSFKKEDPRTKTAGFVAETVRVSRIVKNDRFILMAFSVGDKVTLGCMVYQPFDGEVQLEIGQRILRVPFSTSNKQRRIDVWEGSEKMDFQGGVGRVRKIVWFTMEMEKKKWFKDSTSLSITFSNKSKESGSEKEESVRIPSSGSFQTKFFIAQ